MFKTANLQNIIFTSMGDGISVTNNRLFFYLPNLIPSVETQLLFNEPTQKGFETYFDEYYTERQVITDFLVQHDIVSAQQVQSPKCLICTHQTRIRSDTPNKNDNIAIFDNQDPRKNFIDVDGQRYPRDRSLMNYEEKEIIEQYKDTKLCF